MTAPWRIGESVPRREDRALLTGRGGFFAAHHPARALAMAVVRAPLAHGTIDAIDVTAAQGLAGVAVILTAADLDRNGPLPAIDVEEGALPAHRPLLAAGRVRHVGEPVAVVVAETAEAAREAAAAVRLEIRPLPPVLDTAASLAGAVRLYDGDNAAGTLHHAVGDPEAAFAAAAHVIDETYRFHRVQANPLEPRGALATIDPANGRVTVAASTQIPGVLRAALAALTGLAADGIAVTPLPLGGGFGAKEAVYPEEILVAIAALRLGRPVRWQETRHEHAVATAHGREGSVRVRMALDADGVVTALDVDGLSDIGAYYGFAGNFPGAAMGGMVRGAYRIPHFKARTRSVVTTKTPLNVYRGAGHPQAVFAIERSMDRAAAALGLDRVAIRRRNLIPADAFPHDRGVAYRGAGRIVYDSGDFARCLDEALAAIDAEAFPARREAFRASHPEHRLGIGHAMVVELTATGPAETVDLSVAADGRVTIAVGAVEIGQRAASVLTQIASDALGVDPGTIAVRCSADLAVSGGGTFASRGAAVLGAAVLDGADRLKAAAIALHADLTSQEPAALSWDDGGIVEPGRRNEPVRLADVAARAGHELSRLTVTGFFEPSQSSFASACHIAVVAVDVAIGTVAVLDYAVAHDCGRVINPAGVDDQVTGGVMQGLGATLFEAMPYGDDGQPLARGFLDCPIPVAANLPTFHLRHIETPSPVNPLGAKGAGEGGFTGAPAAIVAAIEDALSEFGLQLTDDGPYTPSRLLGLIRGHTPLNPERDCP